MSKTCNKRRIVRQGSFVYWVDDINLTAWISEGCSDGAEVYTLPEKVQIDGKAYRLTCVEIGAFCSDQERIRELFIPDCYEYIDEDSFKINTLRIVHIGKGFQAFQPWSFTSKLETLTIHPDNPLLSVAADGRCILRTDDETMLVGVVGDPVELRVPEGVESVFNCAISCKEHLERITLPTTLKTIGSNGIFECHVLKELVIPEGTLKIKHDGLSSNTALRSISLPSTLQSIESEILAWNMALERLIIHTNGVLPTNDTVSNFWLATTPLETCRLIVPRHLVKEYRCHPVWGWFKRIESIEDL